MSRFWHARHRVATIIAFTYWCSVVAAYAWAALARDRSGLAFLPFTILGLPWSLLMYLVAEQIPNHRLAAVSYAALCFLFSSVNGLILYSLVAAASALASKALGVRNK